MRRANAKPSANHQDSKTTEADDSNTIVATQTQLVSSQSGGRNPEFGAGLNPTGA